jgi:hypothetical protein
MVYCTVRDSARLGLIRIMMSEASTLLRSGAIHERFNPTSYT